MVILWLLSACGTAPGEAELDLPEWFPTLGEPAETPCNGKDDDSDGAVDEGSDGKTTWWPDFDGDGWGNGVSTFSCAAPADHVPLQGDCDDHDDRVHPQAEEACDDLDRDCDGETRDDHALDAVASWQDLDEDGFGGGPPSWSCEVPADRTARDGDCDDQDPSINPRALDAWYDGVDQDCDGAWDLDADGDRYLPPALGGTDCDDQDPLRSPSAPELCDGIDNDCDGSVDESAVDVVVLYVDQDGDGYGAEEADAGCPGTPGTATLGGDCDDQDPTRSPGEPEVWYDGLDQDCDGNDTDQDGDGVAGEAAGGLDCDDTDATLRPDALWYEDSDQDGHGDPDRPWTSCSEPEGHVASNLDCDDNDDQVSPDATEHCGGADEDCDGVVDEDGAADASTFYLDADGDGFGGEVSPACDLREGLAVEGGDCDDDSTASYPGAEEVCGDGVDNDCDGTTATCGLEGDLCTSAAAIQLWGDQSSEAAGSALAVADVDGDGGLDLVVGGYAADSAAGRVATHLSPLSDGTLQSAGVTVVAGSSDGDRLGTALASGDLNGDGLAEVIIGSPGVDHDRGEVTLIWGPGSVGSLTVLIGDEWEDQTGAAIAVLDEDHDGDGLADWMLGEPGFDGGTGRVKVLTGPATESWSIRGRLTGDGLGSAVAAVGDTDGDGIGDIAVGAPGGSTLAGDAGMVALFRGPGAGDLTLDEADARWVGVDSGDDLGTAIASAGDFDGDGLEDLVLGIPGHPDGGEDAGAVWIVPGTATGTLGTSDIGHLVLGEAAWDRAGSAVAAAGDVDQDGLADIWVGVPIRYQTVGGAGGAILVPGGGSGNASLSDAWLSRVHGEAFQDGLGTALWAGDYDGDGAPDLWVGVPGLDDGAADGGGAALILGMP